MPFYAVIGFDRTPGSGEIRERSRPAHRAYVQANDGGIRLAGAMYDAGGDQCGTLMIVAAESADAVWSWIRREPFYQNGVYRDFHVVRWRCARNDLPQTDGWVANFPASVGPEKGEG